MLGDRLKSGTPVKMGSVAENSVHTHHIVNGFFEKSNRIFALRMNAGACMIPQNVRQSEGNTIRRKTQNLIHTNFCYVAIATKYTISTIFHEKMTGFQMVLLIQLSN